MNAYKSLVASAQIERLLGLISDRCLSDVVSVTSISIRCRLSIWEYVRMAVPSSWAAWSDTGAHCVPVEQLGELSERNEVIRSELDNTLGALLARYFAGNNVRLVISSWSNGRNHYWT